MTTPKNIAQILKNAAAGSSIAALLALGIPAAHAVSLQHEALGHGYGPIDVTGLQAGPEARCGANHGTTKKGDSKKDEAKKTSKKMDKKAADRKSKKGKKEGSCGEGSCG